MKLGGIRFGKKNKPAEEPTAEPKKREKKLKLDRETLEKTLNDLLKPRKKRKRRKINLTLRKLIEMILILLFCFLLMSPISYCVFTDADFVSRAAAQEIGFADSGITADKAEGLKCDMIKLDTQVCYKLEFTSGINGYKYIVNADTGEIIAQAFYQIEKDGDSE